MSFFIFPKPAAPAKAVPPSAVPFIRALPDVVSAQQRRCLYALLALGVGLRLYHFALNHSLFIDELFLNINLIKLDFWQLATQPLAYEQKAPLGYLWVSRLFVVLFGKQERALRLFSLLCGLGSLVLIVPIARYFLRSWFVVLAVGLLALGYPAIYHSVEAKQYAGELTASLIVIYFYVRHRDNLTTPTLLAWGVLGALLVWFSFSVSLMLAGVGITLALTALRHRDYRRCFRLLIPFSFWVLSFGTIYYFFISRYHESGWLKYFFKIRRNAFMPLDAPFGTLKWLATKFYLLMGHPLGLLLEIDSTLSYALLHFLKLGWLPLSLLAIGTYFFLRQRKQCFLLLFLPVALALMASAASLYPFHERFMLFLLPSFLLALSYGAQELSRRLLSTRRQWVLPVLVLLPCLANSAVQALVPNRFYNRAYHRQIMLHINQHFRPGDAVYVYWNMQPAYHYYKEAYALKFTAVQASRVKNQSRSQADYLEHLKPDFRAFEGAKRVWFVADPNMRDPIGDYVDQPAWYYDPAYPPGRVVRDYFTARGKQVAVPHPETYAVPLYELPQ